MKISKTKIGALISEFHRLFAKGQAKHFSSYTLNSKENGSKTVQDSAPGNKIYF